MALDFDTIKNWQFPELRQEYTSRDTILYNLGIGCGTGREGADLSHVYEEDLKSFPTMAFVLAAPGLWMRDPKTGIDYTKVLHAEQRLWLHKPLPVSGIVTSKSHITHVVDKGADKGTIVVFERQLFDAEKTKLATIVQSNYCRADGGLTNTDQSPERLPSVPDRAHDMVFSIFVPINAALIYRLSGDTNPLHVDPIEAKKAGFEKPILHGLCTIGVAARAIVSICADGDSSRLKQLHVRFSAPFYPGETLECRIWHEQGKVSFQARSKERGIIVLDSGAAVVQ